MELKKTMFDFIVWYNNINVSQLALDVDCSFPTLQKFIRGGIIHKNTIREIARVLNIPVESFYDLKNKKHKYYGEIVVTPPPTNA